MVREGAPCPRQWLIQKQAAERGERSQPAASARAAPLGAELRTAWGSGEPARKRAEQGRREVETGVFWELEVTPEYVLRLKISSRGQNIKNARERGDA